MVDRPPDDFEFVPIRVLPWPELARSRPDMYVGDVHDGSGLHNMIALAVADALARHPSRVAVALHDDGSVSVTDDGTAFVIGVEKAFSHLKMYEPGLLPIVCAFSSYLNLRLWRDGCEYLIRFEDGLAVAPLAKVGPAPSAPDRCESMEATFLASADVFGAIAFDRDVVAGRLHAIGREKDVRFELV